MSGEYGRKVSFLWDGVAVSGVREKSFSVNGEAVNVSSDEDSGVQVLLTEVAEASIEYSLSGVTKSDVLRAAKLAGTVRGTATITWENGAQLVFDANIQSYSEGQPYNDAVTFECALASSGSWTYTAGSSV